LLVSQVDDDDFGFQNIWYNAMIIIIDVVIVKNIIDRVKAHDIF
jgi:hypothetical protein